MASTPQRSPRLVSIILWSHIEHALEKPRKNCLVLFKSVWHYFYHFVNGFTSNIFTAYTAGLSPNYFLCFTETSVNVVVAVHFQWRCGYTCTWVLKIVQTDSLTNLIKCMVVCRSYAFTFLSTSFWGPDTSNTSNTSNTTSTSGAGNEGSNLRSFVVYWKLHFYLWSIVL